jgi:hypothetical protein
MKCGWNKIDLGWRSGDIYTMSHEAVEIAKLLNVKTSFLFNGVRVNVSAKTDPVTISTKALEAVKSEKTSIYGEGY